MIRVTYAYIDIYMPAEIQRHIHTGEHENGLLGEVKLIDQEVSHAFSIIDATFELVP